MANVKTSIMETWRSFSYMEKRNISIYILGIVLYKFGLEAFNGSIVALATNRYDFDSIRTNTPARTFERVGLLVGLNQALQCVGSILIAPLIQQFPTKNVLTAAVFVFGVFTAILLIVDAATGGIIVPANWTQTHNKSDFSYYGTYSTDGMIPIYCITGIAYGMVELIRRVIPKDIVGGDVKKLIRMDSLVHICYEVSGTAGAFCTALALIPALGNNFSFLITPILFTAAAIVWYFVSDLGFERKKAGGLLKKQPGYIKATIGGFYLFGESIWTGAKLIFTSRKFVWLFMGYAIALYGHRFLENALAPAIARRYLGDSAWSQVMVGGSNLGELLGALAVFLLAGYVKTPMPWLRLDSLTLLIIWYLPFWYPPAGDVRYAWMVAGTFIPISFGWAAGDVSVSAYIQGTLTRTGRVSKNVSPLGAVMAFLYSTYIIIYAFVSPLLGRYIDKVYERTGGSKHGGDIHEAIFYVGGVHFTIICGVVLISTFIPKGAFSLNPKMLSDEDLEKDHLPESDQDDYELPAGVAAIS